ncbi:MULTISPECIES: response regulator transcription factor [Streptomyces]|jgi:DNA-binding response OmpR family regulator|uniref:Response regulator transcription factor n=1 Tax=Streptomyces ortus TaxID=2867268 RepID=A0ABT3VG48_9ACTN|nr:MULTISPECIES: response regulator transcription factor [Streptomyces]MCX4238912.1 response regulator transcription factor [Streptomyces ortus]
MRVLIVEDHKDLAESVARGLRRHAMEVELAHDGELGLSRASSGAYDVVVLDRDLPLVHGDDICRALVRQGSPSRVLMLTAAGTLADRVDGLDLGADDYLAKPFSFAELIARVQALDRRDMPAVPPVLVRGDIELDPARRTALRGGRKLDLSPKEMAVLEVLLAAGGAVVSAEELLERAWDRDADPFSNTVKVTVSRLRRRLGDPPVIETLPHVGYRI